MHIKPLLATIILALLYLTTLNGFELLKIKGKVVNPACIKLMQPWLSEHVDTPVIIKSVVLDSCQESNLAFKGQNTNISNNYTVSYYEDENDAHSLFAYSYLGKTSNGKHYIYHNGTIGVYTLTKEDVVDIVKHTTKSVSVINKLGDSFIPCFESATITNDTLLIKVKSYNPNNPTASQCSNDIKILTVK